ncbi:MAG: major capsid protein P2 [Oceanisphaera sp.]|nr:major capsid protein P2 [Oceanisphaera sp.]
MSIRTFQLPQVSDVAVSTAGVASLPNIPQGEIYKSLIVKLTSGIVAADIEYVRIRLGGNLIWDVTGSELDTINQWSGLVNSATYLPIHFGDRTAITPEGQRFGEIDTKNYSYSGFSLEIKLDGTQTAKIQDVIAVVDDRNLPSHF